MGLLDLFVAASSILGLASAASSGSVLSASSVTSFNPTIGCQKYIAGIPGCGLEIIINAATKTFKCDGPVDFECQCSNYDALQSTIFSPVLNACGPTTALDVQSGAQELCSCVKYLGNVPPSAQLTRTTAQINPNGNKLCVNYGLAIPTCGTSVLQAIASSKYGCGNFDFQCQCAQIEALAFTASTPVISACGTTTALQVLSAAANLCSCITANNKGLPPASGTIPAAPTVPTSVAYRAGAPPMKAPEAARHAGSLLSVFAGFLAMF